MTTVTQARKSGETNGAVAPARRTLKQLATRANREHLRAQRSGVEMVEHAINAGQALIAAKEQLKHGEWGAWLEANFDPSADTAENYMRIARNSEQVRDLPEPNLRNALRALRGEKAEETGVNPFEKVRSKRSAQKGKAKATAAVAKAIEVIEATDPAGVDDPHAFADRLAVQAERFESAASEVA